MPEFCSSLPSSLKAGEKLSKKEVIRAIRFMVVAEYEAVGLYTQLADSVDCEKVKAVLADIADEERVHAGEFLRLLYELEPERERVLQGRRRRSRRTSLKNCPEKEKNKLRKKQKIRVSPSSVPG